MARARSTMTRVSRQLVAQLHQRHAARGQHPAKIGKIVAAGHLRIDDGVAAKIDGTGLASAHLCPCDQRVAVERVQRIEDFHGEAAGAARASGRDFAGDAES